MASSCSLPAHEKARIWREKTGKRDREWDWNERFISAVGPIKLILYSCEWCWCEHVFVCEPNIIVFSWTCIGAVMLIYELLSWTRWCSIMVQMLCVRRLFRSMYAPGPHMHVTADESQWIYFVKESLHWYVCDDWNDDWLDFPLMAEKAIEHFTLLYVQHNLDGAFDSFLMSSQLKTDTEKKPTTTTNQINYYYSAGMQMLCPGLITEAVSQC